MKGKIVIRVKKLLPNPMRINRTGHAKILMVEEAYAKSMVGKVTVASGKPKKTTFNQIKFCKD